MVRRLSGIVATAGVALLWTVSPARAQDTLEFDRIGVLPHRDYLRLQPFEQIDTQSGNLLLTVSDLTLPGNAGQTLQFQLSHNANGDDAMPSWRFGIAGVPMWVRAEQAWPVPGAVVENTLAGTWNITPILEMADGAQHRTVFVQAPNSNDRSTMNEVWTGEFWRYYRDTHTLRLPDGTNCLYAPVPGAPAGTLRLTQIEDAYGNQVNLTWSTGALEVQQTFGAESSRVVQFAMNDTTGLPTTMAFNDGTQSRLWRYAYEGGANDTTGRLTQATPPLGPGWVFSYDDYAVAGGAYRRLGRLTTPQGGRIEYGYDVRTLVLTGQPDRTRAFLTSRDVFDRGASTSAGQWTIDCHWLSGGTYCDTTTVRTPSALLTYTYGEISAADRETLIEGFVGLLSVAVRAPGGGTPLDLETRTYIQLPVVSATPKSLRSAVVAQRVVTRAGRTYTTTLAYSGANAGDYHHPNAITETGERTRQTTWTYTHPQLSPTSTTGRLILGLPAVQTVTDEGETWTRTWDYDASTGVRTHATEFAASPALGYPTTWTHDPQGNVASATLGDNLQTSFTYAWGQVADTITALYTVHRVINPDGTVASQTQANRTTSYQYDALSRLTLTQRPGGTNPIGVDHGTDGTWMRTTRGPSEMTTTVDGFGRPIETVNSLGVRRRTTYDAEGRVTYEGYPFSGAADKGTAVMYDPLGRVTRRTNPDGTFASRAYGPGTVTLTDEDGHPTTQTWTAAGDPDQARLTALVAAGQSWFYTYHGLGQLATVQAPDTLLRTWQYTNWNRLASESHPESGTVTYTNYDNAGHLLTKTDAAGTTFQYGYDGNDRLYRIAAGAHVTTTTFEPGSDRPLTTTDGSVSTVLVYGDATGRLTRRQQAIGVYVFNTDYAYDANDETTAITYPSGRTIGYDVNSERQITRVYEPAAGRDHVYGLTYHPSSGIETLTSGGLVPTTTTIGYDPDRYWVRSLTAGALQLTYDQYDGVGNVGTIGDARPGMTQSFGYDALDRLTTATGPYGSAGYAYDAHGNRQSGPSGTYVYEPGTLRLAQQDSTVFGYDNNGNLTSASGATGGAYTYTPENWLATATVAGTTTSYAYDADGWRVRATDDMSTTLYGRGADGALLTEWKNPGPQGHIRDYVYAGSRLVAAVDRDVATIPDTCGGVGIPDGAPQAIDIAAGGSATVGFEGSACRRVSVLVTMTSGLLSAWDVKILRPGGAVLGAVVSFAASAFIEPVTLPESGSYSVVVTSTGSGSASATVQVFDVADVTTPIDPNGVAVVAALTVPGQRAVLPFTGVAGRRMSVNTVVTAGSFGCVWSVTIHNPDGSPLGSNGSCLGSAVFVEPVTLPTSGAYTVQVDPAGSTSGTATVNLYDVVDVAVPITANGPAVAADLTTPGRVARLTFDGVAGHRMSVNALVTAGGFGCVWTVAILDPDGSPLGSNTSCLGTAVFLEPLTLPASGTYTVLVDPAGSASGTATVNLYDDIDLTVPIMANGPAVVADLTPPGRNARLMFTGIAGHRMSVNALVTAGDFGCVWTVAILNPDGSPLGSNGSCLGAAVFLEPLTLPASGTYTVLVDPAGSATGTATVNLYDVVDQTGAITANGPAVVADLTTPGRAARLTFTGVAGHRMSVNAVVTVGSLGCVWSVAILNPNGSPIGSSGSCLGASLSLGPVTLPASGTYTVLVDPAGSATGTATVTLTDSDTADVTTPITANGAAVPVDLGVAGRNARLPFAGVAGHRMSVNVVMTSGAFGCSWTLAILKPDGSSLGSMPSCNLNPTFLEPLTLPSAGTYTVLLDPTGSATGTANVSLYDVVDVTASTTVNGTATPVSVTQPGQVARVTFSGKNRKATTVRLTGNTIGSTVVTLQKPDGSTLTTTTSSSAAFNLTQVTLPANGTYTVLVDPRVANTGTISVRVTSP